ncbi:MFS transporter [Planococcus lenghuensis]|uniref:MFS transporter n=1 Tax=Planococcus lenghuensis TaxID=2213202 RepID=A0A1Q2KV21_9BACL|nr:MFS transporter [Planococcus lenghuensis]AQQ51993.1 MFS transporter [Planococcus lenghuensis]
MTEKQPIWTKSFINIFISTFFVFAVFYALLTLLPIYVLDTFDGTAAQAGLVVSVFLLSVILLRPFTGMILDKFGKKPMLLISVLIFGLTTFIYVFTDSIGLLLALRFFHGLSFSIATTVAGAIAADIIPASRRGEGIGYYGMAMNLAVVAGPFIALTLQPLISYEAIFLLFGVIMLAGFVCSLFVKDVSTAPAEKTGRKLSLDNMLERRSFPIAFVGFFVAVAYSSIIAFISIYAETLGLIQTAGFFFAIYAAAMLLVRPFTGRLFDIAGPTVVIIPSFILFSAGLFLLSMTTTSWQLLLSGVLVGLGYGTLLPSLQTLAIQAAPHNRSAYATATFFMMFDAGIASGSLLLGATVGFLGYADLYLALAVGVLLIILLYLWQASRQRIQSR